MRTLKFISILCLLGFFVVENRGQADDESSSNITAVQANLTSVPVPAESNEPIKPVKPKASKKGATEVELSYTGEKLSNGFGDWQSGSISVLHRFDRRKVIYGTYSEMERFRKRDRVAMVGFYQPLNKKWTLLLEGSASPTHKVVQKWSVLAQAERSFRRGLILKGGYRRSAYASSNANILIAEGEKYWGNNRAAYTLYTNHLEKAGTSTSHRVQYSRYYGERVNSLNISASFGRELESLGELGVLQSNVKNLTVRGKHWFKKSLGFNYGFTLHDQGNLYTRRGLTFGLRYKF